MTVMEKNIGAVFLMSSNTLTECVWLHLNPRFPIYEKIKDVLFDKLKSNN